jgi:hypothetical protein
MMRQLARCAATLCVLALATTIVCASETDDCEIGSYRLSDGNLVDIAPTGSDALRWRRFDGTTGALRREANGRWHSSYGWTDRADGKTVSFSGCTEGEIDFDGMRGRRITFDVTNTTFNSHDTALAGRLVMPKGRGKVPLVILLHGAERDSALTDYFLQRMLPADGLAVFVFDKRGTGKSGGSYSQDFNLLADDAVAAMREARRLAGTRAGRVGYQPGARVGGSRRSQPIVRPSIS